MTYELDWNRSSLEDSKEWLVDVLTGLSDEEIHSASPNKKLWHGRDFISVFHKLGFNTSEKFIKWDPQTEKPCIMRTSSFQKGYWYSWIWDGQLVNNMYTLDEFKSEWPDLKITSMLQVWI